MAYVVPVVFGTNELTFGTYQGKLYTHRLLSGSWTTSVRRWLEDQNCNPLRVYPPFQPWVRGEHLFVVCAKLEMPNLPDCHWYGPRRNATRGGQSFWRSVIRGSFEDDVFNAVELHLRRQEAFPVPK